MMYRLAAATLAAGMLFAPLAAQAQTKIKMGTVRSTVIGGALICQGARLFQRGGARR